MLRTTNHEIGFKTWTRVVLTVFFGTLFGLVLFNLLLDPYDYFRVGPWKGAPLTNERLWKLEYLEEHPGRFDSFYLGSSTASQVSPKEIEKFVPDASFYNLNVAAGNAKDIEIIAGYLLEREPVPKRLAVQLDVLFIWRFGDNDEIYKQFGPSVTGENELSYYGSYLLRFHTRGAKQKVWHRFLGGPPGQHDSYDRDTGVYHFLYEEKKIEEDPRRFRIDYDLADNRLRRGRHESVLPQTLASLKRLVAMCQSKGVPLTLVLAPPNDGMMNQVALDDMLAYIRGIAELHPFWDFSGYNSVTLDDGLYYDLNHFRPSVGRRMARTVFGKEPASEEDDFGDWVDTETLDERLARVRREFAWADKVYATPRNTDPDFDALALYRASKLAERKPGNAQPITGSKTLSRRH